VCALAKLKDNESAFGIYKLNCPSYIEDKSDIHKTEPYVYSQMIAGRSSPRYGEAKNSWLTGTASWAMVAATQAILGICPEYDGLKIEPCIPKSFKHFSAIRKIRDCEFYIKVINNGNKTPKIRVDGNLINTNIIPYRQGKIEVIVEL
jgi:cellobiose phosphorylase